MRKKITASPRGTAKPSISAKDIYGATKKKSKPKPKLPNKPGGNKLPRI